MKLFTNALVLMTISLLHVRAAYLTQELNKRGQATVNGFETWQKRQEDNGEYIVTKRPSTKSTQINRPKTLGGSGGNRVGGSGFGSGGKGLGGAGVRGAGGGVTGGGRGRGRGGES